MNDILKLIECPICFEIYSQPRILTNCGHTFCTNCINSQIIINRNNIKCFVCNQSTILINENINSLKINYMFMAIIDYIKNNHDIENIDKYIKNIRNINNNPKSIHLEHLQDTNNDNRCCGRLSYYSLSRCFNERNEE